MVEAVRNQEVNMRFSGNSERIFPRFPFWRCSPETRVELHGNYARGMGMGPQEAVLPNHALLAQVAETLKGNLTFHLWGPRRR